MEVFSFLADGIFLALQAGQSGFNPDWRDRWFVHRCNAGIGIRKWRGDFATYYVFGSACLGHYFPRGDLLWSHVWRRDIVSNTRYPRSFNGGGDNV